MRDASTLLARHRDQFGIHFPEARVFLEPKDAVFKDRFDLAMDAMPALVTTSSSGIPAYLTTIMDPNIVTVLLTKNRAAEIMGEVKRGTWLDQTVMFPVIERTGEVSS